jgi:hypothetical protein
MQEKTRFEHAKKMGPPSYRRVFDGLAILVVDVGAPCACHGAEPFFGRPIYHPCDGDSIAVADMGI